MKVTKNIKARLGLGLYTVGIIFGLLLASALTWADFEASFFEFQRQSAMLVGRAPEQGIDKFSCPLAITRDEVAQISAQIDNPSDRNVRTVLRMSKTMEGPVLMVEQIEEQLEFAPGQSIPFVWPVQASDAAWDRFVMARAFVIPSSPMPSMASYCGILVIDFPLLTGNQIFGLLSFLAISLVVSGWRVWMINADSQNRLTDEKNSQLMLAYAALIAFGYALSILSSWILAGLVILLTLLLGVGIVSYYFGRSSR